MEPGSVVVVDQKKGGGRLGGKKEKCVRKRSYGKRGGRGTFR